MPLPKTGEKNEPAFVPDADDIARITAKIQAGWSRSDRIRRGEPRCRWEVPAATIVDQIEQDQ